MKAVTILAVAAVLGVAAPAFARQERPPLLEVEAGWNAAIVRGDGAYVDRLLAPDFELIYNDTLVSRADVVKGTGSPGRTIAEGGSKDQHVRLYGDTGVITGIYFERGRVGEHSYETETRYTDVYAWQGDRWMPVSAHASRMRTIVDGKPQG